MHIADTHLLRHPVQPVPALPLMTDLQQPWPEERVIYHERTKNLHLSLQVNSAEFIHCKELVDQELMCLQPSNAVYIFYPISQAIQGHPKARLPYHDPSGLKNSHPVRSRVAVSQPVLAPFTPTTAQTPDDTMETDEYYDGFRHLYSEDGGASGGRVNAGGSCPQLRPGEGSSPCPPLQPPERD